MVSPGELTGSSIFFDEIAVGSKKTFSELTDRAIFDFCRTTLSLPFKRCSLTTPLSPFNSGRDFKPNTTTSFIKQFVGNVSNISKAHRLDRHSSFKLVERTFHRIGVDRRGGHEEPVRG